MVCGVAISDNEWGRAESDVSLIYSTKNSYCQHLQLIVSLHGLQLITDLVIEGRKQWHAPNGLGSCSVTCGIKRKSLPTLIVRSRDAEYNSPSPPQMIFSTESAWPESVTSQRPVRVFQI